MTVILPVHTRLVDGRLFAYDLSRPPAATGPLSPDAVFDLMGEDGRVEGRAVTRDLSRAVYATTDVVRCVDRDGRVFWRLEFGPRPEQGLVNARVSCEFSLDERLVWIYRPDGMAMRGNGLDRWLVVDTVTGDVRADVELPSVGHGAEHFPEPDGVHMLLDVGEGQDGSRVFRGRPLGADIGLADYPWEDRVVVSLAPDGRHVMTVHHEQEDVAFHTWPDGAEVVRIPLAAFGQEWGDAMVEWAGGYLDPETAVVTVVGEDEETEQEWHRHHLVDVRTGEIRGVLDAPTRNSYDLEPLGDGSFLRTDEEGRPWRHRPGA
ncbi:hypothetical protein EV384_5227 [Micromonospora kangleipakensis]|uniref:Arylsulfotransferase ASST n=1 Tax=Micromonospora kangleipakensis TaxID=1077942 RepID=A0A4Q8BF28_9ACTN|nr:hypothetical protein [Micromonospora kangleipakensis]RZU76562.1 hypothetical protein EV384_5227 [Micromonospora kangleipakensis]